MSYSSLGKKIIFTLYKFDYWIFWVFELEYDVYIKICLDFIVFFCKIYYNLKKNYVLNQPPYSVTNNSSVCLITLITYWSDLSLNRTLKHWFGRYFIKQLRRRITNIHLFIIFSPSNFFFTMKNDKLNTSVMLMSSENWIVVNGNKKEIH